MAKKLTLDFKKMDVEDYLHSSIPVRFQNTNSRDFEEFVAHFFRTRGYGLKTTNYSQDFGADMILDQDGIKTAVKVLRYSATHKVGKNDLLPLVNARKYYRCKHAMMITTSSFDDAAKAIGLEERIILWDWHTLLRALTDTFLEGLQYQEYFSRYPASVTVKDSLEFKLDSIDFSGTRFNSGGKAYVKAKITNRGDSDIEIQCELPSLVKKDRSQFRSTGWGEDTFVEGILYAKSTVEVIFTFPKRQLTKFDPKDRIVLSIKQKESEEHVNLEQKLAQIKQECFLVSFCFDRNSREYHDMIFFRDHILCRTAFGRLVIAIYYRVGSIIVGYLGSFRALRYVLGPLLLPIIKLCAVFVADKPSD